MQKNIFITVAVAIIVGVVGFFGGMKYQEKKAPSIQNLANLSPEQRQQAFQQFRGNGAGGNFQGARAGGNRQGGGFVGGEILSKDDKSITIKMPDGSSKIVNLSSSTQVSKPTEVQSSELATGQQVTVTGTPNQDGTITATAIQIRSANATPTPPGR